MSIRLKIPITETAAYHGILCVKGQRRRYLRLRWDLGSERNEMKKSEEEVKGKGKNDDDDKHKRLATPERRINHPNKRANNDCVSIRQ